MSDDNGLTQHLLFLKEQVLRFAAAINHKHKVKDIEDLNDQFAPKNHASESNQYGEGTSTQYGHVKTDDNVTDSINPVKASGIIQYVTEEINKLYDKLKNELQDKLNIVTSITGDTPEKTDDKYNIPTAKAVWDAIVGYEDLFTGRSWDKPKEIDISIDELVEPGYYLQIGTSNRYFTYGGEIIFYVNGLIRVEKQSNRVIQHVYTTSKITSGNETTYKINGSEYTRWGTSTTDWKAWHVAHKPYTKTNRAVITSTCKGVDEGSIVVYENTAGFMIHWDQYKQDQQRYPVSAPLYEYADVCYFEPALPIKGPYVFGNLIGRMDIKITSDKMQIRSNVNPGGRIIEMHEAYFVPRNQ